MATHSSTFAWESHGQRHLEGTVHGGYRVKHSLEYTQLENHLYVYLLSMFICIQMCICVYMHVHNFSLLF